MSKILGVTLLLALTARYGLATKTTFPDGFSFGAATAAYQVEGAWNVGGRTESIWDKYIHSDPTRINNNDTADEACDSYHKYKEDIQLAVDLKLTHYRFSISWSRLLPTGFNNEINVVGLMYYENIILELEKNNITPMVTIYHWDLPQSLQDLGGWTNPDIVDYFTDYAEVVFTHFPTVKYWITINEPKQVCERGYGNGTMAPGYNQSGISDYTCAYHVALAHASAYRLYQKKFKDLGGRISMAMDGAWNVPASDDQKDIDAAERRRLFEFGLYAHPIFHGDFPEVVKNRVQNRSLYENFPKSRLPTFTEEQKMMINNSVDFLALNYYNIRVVGNKAEEPSYATYSFEIDENVDISVDPNWNLDPHLNAYVPSGFRNYLKWLKDTYDNPEIFITENGIADDGDLDDAGRVKFLQDYLGAVLESIYDDGVNITGYTFWSLLDNFEWNYGYSQRFGLYQVDFDSPNKTRTPKTSAKVYRQIIENHGFNRGVVQMVFSPILLILTVVCLYY